MLRTGVEFQGHWLLNALEFISPLLEAGCALHLA